MEDAKTQIRKRLIDMYIQDCLEQPYMIKAMHHFLKFVDKQIAEYCKATDSMGSGIEKKFENLKDKIQQLTFAEDLPPEQRLEISITGVYGLGHLKRSEYLGNVVVGYDETNQQTAGEFVAMVAAVIAQVIEECGQMNPDSRIEFSTADRLVRFNGAITEDIAIDLAEDLLGFRRSA